VPSAPDTVSEVEFAQLLPGLEALFAYRGYLALLSLLPILPLGFIVQGLGLYRVPLLYNGTQWLRGA
jgi:hypothetical protein